MLKIGKGMAKEWKKKRFKKSQRYKTQVEENKNQRLKKIKFNIKAQQKYAKQS